jgi:transposase
VADRPAPDRDRPGLLPQGPSLPLCVACHDTGRIVWARPGNSRAVLHGFDELGEEGCARLETVSTDIHGALAEVIRARARNALVCTDPFHVVRAAARRSRRYAA